MEQCKKVLEEDPNSITALMNLGRLYYMLGHMKKSIEAYKSGRTETKLLFCIV